ncbi:ATP-binding protein [Ruegeria sp.]|uniref:ATP-binding protein n=1 Tax=Ruegeria sp. TaxID=1879320 RepID=UPI0023086B46|nr:ATP-binding protein [Ruegeria sp.]MDA7963243.1 ATP-binding protein [Ruegeria sp.]
MTDLAESLSSPVPQRHERARLIALGVIAAVLCALPAFGVLPDVWNTGLIVIGASFFVVAAGYVLLGWIGGRVASRHNAALAAVIEQEGNACFITNAEGEIQVANARARQRFQVRKGVRLDACLGSIFANPAAILLRLQSRAQGRGYACEDIVARGQAAPVSVTELEDNLYCWRIGLEAQRQWEAIATPVLTVGHDDAIIQANGAARKLLGENLTGLEQITKGEVSRSGGMVRLRTTSGPQTVLVSTLRRSGFERDLLLMPVKYTQPAQGAMSFADLPVPIMRLSPEGDILETNPLADRLVGELQPGRSNIEDLMQGLGHPILNWLSRSAEQDQPPHSEFLRLTRRDKEVFVQVTLSRILWEGQICLLAVLNDATELKTLEAQFVQGQKMQAVGQLAGGVAHDFNNLLTAISGHCDLLLLRHDQNDANYGDLVQINQNANRAAALVSQLLAFSRKQTLRPEVLDLRDTISDLIHLLNRLVGEKVRLTLSHDPVLKPVRADKRQLEQVLMNLVVNARDAMPEGGEIRIETEVVSLDQPLTRDRATVQPGEYVTVKVVDSGIGIPADKLQKVFEPFYTTKRTGEGTGLGLSTVYGIVKQTGGFIFVDSVQGRGTEFTVFLPVCKVVEVAEPDTIAPPEEQGSQQGEGVVLLVEDEAPVRAFATRALRLKGYTVLEADSAEAALHLLEDDSLSVDVFVTDVVMPGMDGPTWVRQAMEQRPDVRVIFMSGYAEGAFGDSGPEIENSTFLPKPFSLTQLTEAVFQQLN